MKKTVYVCDICNREFSDDKKLYTLECKNSGGKKILKKVLEDIDIKEDLDVCYDCLMEIRKNVNKLI